MDTRITDIAREVVDYALRYRCTLADSLSEWEGDGPDGSFGLDTQEKARVAEELGRLGFEDLDRGIRNDRVEASFSLCDHLNPGFGYQVRITDGRNGNSLLFTSRNPVTGDDLLTARDCLTVIEWFVPPAK